MPTATPSLFGRITAAQRDHLALLGMVDRLRELQKALSKLGYDTQAESLYLIQDFAVQLRLHFSAEESDAYFGALASERPALGPRIERLQKDHREMVDSLANLPALVNGGITGRDLSTLLGGVLDFFQDHERRENLLMQDFLLRDEGVPGD